MKITSAEERSSTFDKKTKRGDSGGLFINLLSSRSLRKGDVLVAYYADIEYYFNVKEVVADGANLKITAKETGHYRTSFTERPDFDLRHLTGLELSQITDADKLRHIHTMACWT